MVTLTEEKQYASLNVEGPFILAGDIGGTNSNFGIFALNDIKPTLLLSLHYKSQEIEDFNALLKQLLEHLKTKYNIEFSRVLSMCLGVAGIVNQTGTYARLTNLTFIIDTERIKALTDIKNVFLINDFESVALGVDYIDSEDLVMINKGEHKSKMNKAFIGAGTGLGKSVLTWSTGINCYIPVASEGGHADVSIYTKKEFEFLQFVQNELKDNCSISWENVLSGKGIQRIYRFLSTLNSYPITKYTREIEENEFEPDYISYYAKRDSQSKDTFKWYARFYARCVKNFALDALALNGIYIAGGIAAKNIPIFRDHNFMHELRPCGKHDDLVSTMPLYIIADYNISLYGAFAAYKLYEEGLI